MTRPTLRGTLLPAPAEEDAGVPVPARDALSLLASLRPGRSWLTRLENIYIAVFVVGIIIGLFWTASKRLGTLFVDVASFYHFIWGPALIVLVFLGVLRYSTVQGFVTFSEPDCVHLLPTPILRRDLVRPRLISATVLLAIVGAIAGILMVVTSDGSHSGGRVGLGALAGLALGSAADRHELARAAAALGDRSGDAADPAAPGPGRADRLPAVRGRDGQTRRSLVGTVGLGHPAADRRRSVVHLRGARRACAPWR